MLMSEEAYAVPGLRAALGRLANSDVAVLGPELSPGTDVYSKCKALIREVQVQALLRVPERLKQTASVWLVKHLHHVFCLRLDVNTWVSASGNLRHKLLHMSVL